MKRQMETGLHNICQHAWIDDFGINKKESLNPRSSNYIISSCPFKMAECASVHGKQQVASGNDWRTGRLIRTSPRMYGKRSSVNEREMEGPFLNFRQFASVDWRRWSSVNVTPIHYFRKSYFVMFKFISCVSVGTDGRTVDRQEVEVKHLSGSETSRWSERSWSRTDLQIIWPSHPLNHSLQFITELGGQTQLSL